MTVDISSKDDGLTAYHFDVNVSGVQLDGVRFDDTDYSGDWDGLWYSATSRDARGWTAELAIPLRTLRYDGRATQFGFQVRRILQRRQEVDEWAYVPRTARGEVSYYGALTGLVGLRARRLWQLVPYVMGRLTLTSNQPPLDGLAPSGSMGADLKIGITSALTLDATINPDFGQVEADQVVLNLSTFETFYPEKRPFFLEGAEIFSTPLQQFYSRRIGHAPPSPTLGDGEVLSAPLPDPRIWAAAKLSGLVAPRARAGWAVPRRGCALGERPLHPRRLYRRGRPEPQDRRRHLGRARVGALPPGQAPDFRDGAINVNLVLRWEWRPGSTLIAVYTHASGQTPFDPTGEGPGRLRLGRFVHGPATDVLLLKLSALWG